MSTRANIIIKKEGKTTKQLYHHHDGYPSGVGMGLFEHFQKLDENEKKKAVKNTNYLVKFLTSEERWDEYRLDKCVCLHSDIEYLYVIDLDKETITCYNVCCWDCDDDDKMISGEIDDKEVQVFVYSLPMWTNPDDFEPMVDELDEILIDY